MSTDDHNIPTTIMAQIRRQASEDWADDPDMLNHMIDEECEAFEELHTMKIENLLTSVLMGLKEAAGREHPMSYSEQLDYVRNEAKRYLYVRKLRKDIEPIKDLLIKIEKIIGSECYNANIQNYGPGGVWEGEGRSFRYPVTVIVDDKNDRLRTVSPDVESEVLMTGRYKFGANELNIFRALAKVIDLLQDEYGLQLTRPK